MSELRACPLCSRHHEVADDGTIPTWDVIWDGDEVPRWAKAEGNKTDQPGYISNRESSFIHYDDAVSEYNWIKDILQKRGDWIRQQAKLTLAEGDRASWEKLFSGNEEDGVWIA